MTVICISSLYLVLMVKVNGRQLDPLPSLLHIRPQLDCLQ